jgi:F-type H+-transporting ATPase subunit epsilon
MPDMPISVSIVTPEKLVLQTEAESIVVPAFNGELGILKDHAPLLLQLQAGQIRLLHKEGTELFAVSAGFAEVRDNQVSIFAETAEHADEIDLERARQAAERAKLALRNPSPDLNLAQAEAALRRALARQHAVEFMDRHGHRKTRG